MFEVTIPHLEQDETKMIFEGKDKKFFIEVSDAFFNNEYFEYDEFIQCTMHPRVQRIKTNAECSHSIPFVAACGIREIHLLAAW